MPGNPVVGSTILRRPAIQSPNFVQSPLTGWAINADGSAYFANVTAQGNITASSFTGTDWLINSAGQFFYSGVPAAGNLVLSNAPAAGTDGFGNHYLAGAVAYSATTATQLNTGQVTFYTGSLAAGWTAAAQIFISGSVIELITSGGVITSNNTLDNGTGGASFGGNVTIAGTLSVGGSTSTSTNGLPNGQITNNSGPASTGTAHTHSAGTYAVTNGQHSHTL